LEKRNFKIAPGMVFHIIEAQAGTLGKALLEAVMNSIDAKATRVDITLDDKTFTAVDDGVGFRDRREIEVFFETFGFDHDQDDKQRTYGKFGMGRGQMFSFASTVWRTGQYLMDVDIKYRGLDYHLVDNQEIIKGCEIKGTFYEQLLPSDQEATLRELKELAMYAQIPVTVNGKIINKLPAHQKWQIETEDAYISLKEGSPALAVYNLGVLVRKYPAYQFGCGGTLVSKKPLMVNFARNDVLVAKCDLWKRLRKYLQKKNNSRVKNKSRLTEEERQNLIDQFKAGELSYSEAVKMKLITDTTGKNWEIQHLAYKTRLLTVEPAEGSGLAEQVHLKKIAFVLALHTLNAFDVDSAEELIKLFQKLSGMEYSFRSVKIVPFSEVSKTMDDGRVVLTEKELSPRERIVLSVINKVSYAMVGIIRHLSNDVDLTHRTVKAGVADVSDVWTDGSQYIIMHRNMLKLADEGTPGFFRITVRLIHAYIHNSADTGDHLHDQAFYQLFHDVLSSSNRFSLGDVINEMEKAYIKLLQENDEKLRSKSIQGMDQRAKIDNLADRSENIAPFIMNGTGSIPEANA